VAIPIPQPLPPPERRRAYLAIAASTIMSVLDGTIANTALPAIARELGVTPSASVWIVNGFQLALTASLFAWASFGALRGLARGWRYGVAIFTLGSLACAFSHTLPLLVAARMLQGIGAGAIMSIGPALMRSIFPPHLLGRAIGINALIIAIGIAAGPTIGGAILAIAPWPWLFLVNVPIGIAIAVIARGVLAAERHLAGPLDIPSIAASAVGFSGIIFGIDSYARGEQPLFAVLQFAAGAVAFGWFIARQRRLERPMFETSLFRRPLFTLSASTSFLGFTSWGLAFVSLPFLFQLSYGATPLASGLLMTSWPLTMALLAPISGHLSDRYPAALLTTGGLLVFACGLVLYALLPAHPSALEIVVHGALCGLGCGIYQSPNSRELMASAPPAHSGSAAAILAAARVGGQTTGAALVAVIFAAFAASLAGVHTGAPVVRTAVAATLWAAAAFAVVAALVSSNRFRFPRMTSTAPRESVS
jgi:DHA2 family multidrug resistance protein-like MFS transporter